ncbi:MAG: glycosyltransferase [Candidatus Zixiibacteriota bacterium]|nr:MAG: glycosyltransferase [candidate division Zixibacteria bacterium]
MSEKIVILGYSGSVHVIRWAQGLTERGLKVVVISLGGAEVEGVETIVLPLKGRRSIGYLWYLPKVKELIRTLRPDLVHAHYATGFGLWGRWSGFHPLVMSVWGTDVVEFPRNLIKRYVLRRILRAADHLTAASRFLKKKIVRLCRDMELRITVVPFGVSIPEKKGTGSEDDKVRLVYIKAHEKLYGPDVLLEAMGIAAGKNPRVHLVLAGEGSMTARLKKQAKNLGLDEHVRFAGFIDNRKIFDFLGRHDIMVMPSLAESFGVAALEAAAAGLPVIAGDVGGVSEVVIDGKTGILVPPGDAAGLAEAIIRLVEDADLRKKMGEAGRQHVAAKYRWENCLDQMVQIYERAMAGKS